MGTEGIQDKYINPYTDFGFKLLFGTAMNKELFEAAEIAKFNPKELGEYWESLKNFRDWYSVMSTQLKKGREEGLKEGLEQGRKEECFKNAKKMKQAGIAFDVIAQVTGLSIGGNSVFVSRLQHQSVQHLDIKPYRFLNFRNHDIFISRM